MGTSAMGNKVPATPSLPITGGAAALAKALYQELTVYAYRLNLALLKDGTEPMTAPSPLLSVTVAQLASTWAAASYTGTVVFVSNETSGATLAFSDGTNWRRVQDRVIVS